MVSLFLISQQHGWFVPTILSLLLLPLTLLFRRMPHGTERVNIVALPIPVSRHSPHQCEASTTDAATSDHSFPFPTNKPIVVEGFPATPLIGDQFLNLTTHDSIVFRARSSKFQNGPILSTGSAMLFETTKDEYRLLSVKAYLNYSAIHPNEGVESDICVNVMPKTQINSVSSGQEVFCTHEAFFGGDPLPITQRNNDVWRILDRNACVEYILASKP